MSQLNIHMTRELALALKSYMLKTGIRKKSQAVRRALDEALAQLKRQEEPGDDFKSWLGLGLLAPTNPKPRFKSDDELWGDGK